MTLWPEFSDLTCDWDSSFPLLWTQIWLSAKFFVLADSSSVRPENSGL